MNESDFVELPDLSWRSISDILIELQEEGYFSVKLGGGSGKGWSFWGTLERCPRAFQYRYVEPPAVKPDMEKTSRGEGSVFHALLALHYLGKVQRKVTTPEQLATLLTEKNANPQSVAEGLRLFVAYRERYTQDYLTTAAVEHTAVDPETGNSCRYDLVARVKKNDLGVAPGIYDVEHKSLAARSADNLSGWELDGEVLGQIALWDKSEMRTKFGPLQGVIVNITWKTKIPGFDRIVVVPQAYKAERHLRVLHELDVRRRAYEFHGEWPQYVNGCIARYGKCDYFDVCANEGL